MENELKAVDIFIGTTLRGSAKGSGRVMYIMRTKRKNGSDYEAAPQIAEYDDTTESASVLYAILWEMVLQQIEDGGHILLAESEKHEYAEWMRFNLPLKRALKDIFAAVPKD